MVKGSGISVAHFPDRGWRRVVASPRPLEIIESSTVRRLAEGEVIVIAASGGGIPVIENKGKLKGVDAVIDKDLASAVLATSIVTDILIFLTDVPKVELNFQTPEQLTWTQSRWAKRNINCKRAISQKEVWGLKWKGLFSS